MVPIKRNVRRKQGRRFAEVDTQQPRGDPPVVAMIEPLDTDPAVDAGSARDDEAGRAQQAELPTDRGATQAELRPEARWSPWRESQRGDDPTSRRIGQELDAGSVPLWHIHRMHPALHCD
jgi:hypothetical protein